MDAWISNKLRIDTLVSIALGVVFLLIVLILRLIAPRTEGMAIERVVQITLALSAAGIATGIPGLLSSSMDIRSPRKAFTIKITGGFVVFLVVFAVHPKPAQTVAAIEVLLIFLTPLLLRHSLRRYRLRLSKVSLTVLTVLVMAGAAALFSELVGGRTLALPPGDQVRTGVFSAVDLSGSSTCRSCLQHVWVRPDSRDKVVRAQTSPDNGPKLHLLLANVEWRRWERSPRLERNYEGSIYYALDTRCNAQLVAYSLKPGARVLSWLMGFAEVPFLLDDNSVRAQVERVARDSLPRLCSQ